MQETEHLNMQQSFEQFLNTSQGHISINSFFINITLTAILAIILSFVYTKFGNTLSNRRQFGKNFLLLAITTMLIITIVKSSLALSLGLVGALSIVRFRSAIKEPEELTYLFLCIAIGLGFGADQTAITLIAFLIICFLIITAKQLAKKQDENHNLHFIIQNIGDDKIKIEKIIDILKSHCDEVDLKRLDETDDMIEASFMVAAQSFDVLNKAKVQLQQVNKKIKFTFLDNKGLF